MSLKNLLSRVGKLETSLTPSSDAVLAVGLPIALRDSTTWTGEDREAVERAAKVNTKYGRFCAEMLALAQVAA